MKPIDKSCPNYTQTPNWMFELMNQLSGAEFKVLMFIARQTFGWRDKPSVTCTIDDIKAMTGLSDQGVANAVKDLIDADHIRREAKDRTYNYWVVVTSDSDESTAKKVGTQGPDDMPKILGSGSQKVGARNPKNLGVPYIGKETETERLKKAAGAAPDELPPEALLWNQKCGDLPKVKSMPKTRLRNLNTRREDPFFVANFAEAVERVAASNHCNGKTKPRVEGQQPWRATFDFMLQSDSVVKAVEGSYDNPKPFNSRSLVDPAHPAPVLSPNGFWNGI